MNVRALAVAVSVVLGLSVLWTLNAAGQESKTPTSKARFNIVAPGTLSRGEEMFATMTHYAPTDHNFKIEFIGPERRVVEGLIGKGLSYYLYQPPPGVTVIRIETENADPLDDPKVREKLKALARHESVTINIDMNTRVPFDRLGDLSGQPVIKLLGRESVSKAEHEAQRLAKVATFLAEEHNKNYKNSDTHALFHSWATKALPHLKAYEQQKKVELIKDPIAASPVVRPNEVADRVKVMLVEGDIPPQLVSLGQGLERGQLDDPKFWARSHDVIEIKAPPGSSIPERIAQHSWTWQLEQRRDMKLWPKGAEQPIEVKDNAPMKVLQVINQASVAQGQGVDIKSPVQRIRPVSEVMREQMEKAIGHQKEIFEKQKASPVGGISLTVPAILPIKPDFIKHARFDLRTGRIVLEGRNPELRWFLPPMDSELVRIVYRSIFERRIRPELSFGTEVPSKNFCGDSTRPGYVPVYYTCPIQGTVLGLIMLRADIILWDIAFSDNSLLKIDFPGFHSLAELFPAKYTDNPAQERFAGTEERILLQTHRIELVEGRLGDLHYRKRQDFIVRFGNPGPAELAFAASFAAHYGRLLQRFREFQDLLEAARVTAVMTWLSDNKIPFIADTLVHVDVKQIFTPVEIARRKPTLLDSIKPLPPHTFFNAFGPTHVFFDEKGRVTRFEYHEGKIARVLRWDGKVLGVHYASNGRPVAITVNDGRAAAFEYEDGREMPYFVDNVVLKKGSSGGLSYALTRDSVGGPESDPEQVVAIIARSFAIQR